MAPAVSVILNSYNQQAYLRQAIKSVLAQTYGDFELIAIDNGSTDASASILEEYESDPRIRLLLHSDNRPITSRFNEGVAACSGDFVSFLYSDDIYLPNKIERQLARFKSLDDSWGVVYGPPLGYNQLTGRSWQYGSITESGYVFESLLKRASRVGEIDMVNPLTRRACLLDHPFHEDIFAEGEAIFLRIALTHRFGFLAEPLVVLRDHGANAGKALCRNCEMNLLILERLRADCHLKSEQQSIIDAYEPFLLRTYGWAGARTETDPAWARQCLRRAIALSPLSALHPKVPIAYCLTLLPGTLRRWINDLGHLLKNNSGNPVAVADYNGPYFQRLPAGD